MDFQRREKKEEDKSDQDSEFRPNDGAWRLQIAIAAAELEV